MVCLYCKYTTHATKGFCVSVCTRVFASVCVHVLKIKTKVSEVLKDLGVNQLPGYQSLFFFF